VCRLYLAWALWYLGFPDRAVETIEEALALGRRLTHIHSLAFALTWAALLHNFRREFDAVQDRADAAIDLARAYRLTERLADATMCRGCALVGFSHHEEGIALLRDGLTALNASGARLPDAQWLGIIAEAHVRAGQFDKALTALDEAARTAAETGECDYKAELLRLRGVVLAQTGHAVEAESWLEQAIDTAHRQQAKSLELRAACSLGRLWRDQGKRAQAHGLLAPIYDWFTEGFDTADLKDAKVLLEELVYQY
jgi:predicted ATPase